MPCCQRFAIPNDTYGAVPWCIVDASVLGVGFWFGHDYAKPYNHFRVDVCVTSCEEVSHDHG